VLTPTIDVNLVDVHDQAGPGHRGATGQMQRWLDWADLLDHLVTTLAVLVGGTWAYFKYVRGRTFASRAEVAVSGALYTADQQQIIKATVALKNTGASKLALERQGKVIRVHTASIDGSSGSSELRLGPPGDRPRLPGSRLGRVERDGHRRGVDRRPKLERCPAGLQAGSNRVREAAADAADAEAGSQVDRRHHPAGRDRAHQRPGSGRPRWEQQGRREGDESSRHWTSRMTGAADEGRAGEL
jgi:hypothetical protein